MNTLPRWMIAPLAIASLATATGCVVRVRPVGPPPPPAAVVTVEPGYYYDDEYYDVYGVYHPRAYWYYDGRGWDQRPFIPHGYEPRFRGPGPGYGPHPEFRGGGHAGPGPRNEDHGGRDRDHR